MKVTKRIIDEAAKKLAASNRDRELLWDDEIAGFGVRLTKKGGCYFLNYRNAANVERRITLGTLAELTIDAARKRAAEMKVSIRAGADPLGEIRAKAAAPEPVKALTLAELYAKWSDLHKGTWSNDTWLGYKSAFNKHLLPKLGQYPAGEITKAQVAEVIADVRTRSPSAAAHALRSYSSCLGWGEELNLLEEARVPRAKRIAPPVDPRERMATDEEIVALWSGADKLPARDGAVVRMLILSVLRSGIMDKMKPSWLVGSKFFIPKGVMKNKREHQVPFADWALPYIMPCLELGHREVKLILPEAREAAGTPDVNFHDLRRSFRTWCSKVGIVGDHAEFAIAHVSHQSKLHKTYDKHLYIEEANRALLAWQEHVRKLVGIKKLKAAA